MYLLVIILNTVLELVISKMQYKFQFLYKLSLYHALRHELYLGTQFFFVVLYVARVLCGVKLCS